VQSGRPSERIALRSRLPQHIFHIEKLAHRVLGECAGALRGEGGRFRVGDSGDREVGENGLITGLAIIQYNQLSRHAVGKGQLKRTS
jgi:hypothetical protein